MKTIIIKNQQELASIQKTGKQTLLRFKGNAKNLFLVEGTKLACATFYKGIGWVDGYGKEFGTIEDVIEAMLNAGN